MPPRGATHVSTTSQSTARSHLGAWLPVLLVAATAGLATTLSAGWLGVGWAAPLAILLAAAFLLAERWSAAPRPGRESTGLAAVVEGHRRNGMLAHNLAAIVVELRGIAADTLVDGPAAWSEPIAVVARRMAAADLGKGFALARLGPHTFGAVLEVDDRADAVAAAETLVALCRVPVQTPLRSVQIDAVAGLSHAPVGDRCTGEELIRAADASLRVDGAVASPVATIDRPLLRHARRVIEVETEIRHSLDVDLLTAKLIPVVDVRADEIVGFRSAYDWTSVSSTDPDQLTSIAASLGLRRAIETQYLMRSISAAESLPLDEYRRIVARIDATRLADPGVISQIDLLLRAGGIDPSTFVLEFSSWGSAVLDAEVIDRLVGLGVGIGLSVQHNGAWERVPEALFGRLDSVSVRARDLLDDTGVPSSARIERLQAIADGDRARLTVIEVDDAPTALELSAGGLPVQSGRVHGRPMTAPDLRRWLLHRTGG